MLKEWLLKADGCRRQDDKVSDSVTKVCVVVGGGAESQAKPSPGLQTSDGLPGVKGRRVSAAF